MIPIIKFENIVKDVSVTAPTQTTITIITRIDLKYGFDNEINDTFYCDCNKSFYTNEYDYQSQYLTTTTTIPYPTRQPAISLNEMNNVRNEINVLSGVFGVCLYQNISNNEIISGMFDFYFEFDFLFFFEYFSLSHCDCVVHRNF